jgi:hypothetical protein
MALKTKGMTRLVTPPPMLPQPAAVALTRPTTDLLYICVHQTCEVTKVARPMPIKPRHTMKPAADSTKSMPSAAGQMMKQRKASVRRGPSMSQTYPVTCRATVRGTHGTIGGELPAPQVYVRYARGLYAYSAGTARPRHSVAACQHGR